MSLELHAKAKEEPTMNEYMKEFYEPVKLFHRLAQFNEWPLNSKFYLQHKIHHAP